jgi:hypothetical protein
VEIFGEDIIELDEVLHDSRTALFCVTARADLIARRPGVDARHEPSVPSGATRTHDPQRPVA